jgi:adenylate cyclase
MMLNPLRFCPPPYGRAVGLGLLAFVLVTALSFLKLGQTLENLAYDLFYRVRPIQAAPPELLIVGIDEGSFQELQRSWPWPRRVHAQLLERLAAAGASCIVLDLLFADPSLPEDDEMLSTAIRKAGNVILIQTFEVTKDPLFFRRVLVHPLESLRQQAKEVGLSMVTPDADGVVRRFRVRLGDLPTLPFAVARSLRPQLAIPADLAGLINYVGPPRSIETISYYQVIDPQRPVPASRIRNRIVLVGRILEASVSPQGQADAFYTPYFAGTGQLMSGVEVQGNILHDLLTGAWLTEIPLTLRLPFCLVVAVLFGFLVARLSPWAGLGVWFASLFSLGGLSLYLFLKWNTWGPPVLLSGGLTLIYGGNVLIQYFHEAQEKRWLRQAFGRYVSPSLVEAITDRPEQLRLGGEEVEVTVLFADLAGFTPLSEEMAPHDLIRLLNEYFSPMTQIILAHQGTLDKFIGDAIMALWGAPVPLPEHARLACTAALKMQAAMRRLQKQWQAEGLPLLSARMGLHSGPVIAGNVGSRERFNYTVMGDTVNLTSRLEGVNKLYGTEILLSEVTCQYVAGAFLVRELDQVQVRGRAQPVTIYELLGPLSDAGPPPWLPLFLSGRAAYRQRDWPQASSYFERVLALKPEDPPAKLYLERCRFYLKQPPPSDWQGIFLLESK